MASNSAPTLSDIDAALAAQGPSLVDIDKAIAAKSQDDSWLSKAGHAVTTAGKALNSVTLAPVEAGIYATQNGKNPLSAAWDQFGNMTDEAPTGKDIFAKAGFSTDPSTPRMATLQDPSFGGPQSDRMAMMKLGANSSPAGVAGGVLDVAANPLNLAGPAVKVAGKAAEALGPMADALSVSSKPTAEAVKAAASRLGFTATPGMLSDSHVVQGLESTLSQSPTIPGAVVRSGIKPVQKALQNAAEELVSGPSTSSYEAGNSASSGITANLGEKVSNVKMAYEPFNQELPKMVPAMEDRWKLADQVAKIGEQHLDPNEVQGLIKGTTNKIMNSESLADIEETRKQLGQKITTALNNKDGALADTLTKVKDKLSNFRDDQFQTLAQKAYPGPDGAAIGQQMVGEYKNAMAQHNALMNDLRDVGPLFGIKAKNPRDFIESFNEIPPEQVAKKLFQSNNVNAIQKVKQYFPEEFETIQNMKLQDLRNSSLSNPIDPQNSPVDPAKLISNINKIKSPEVRQILFGDKAQKVSDMQTVLGSFPNKIGPSGTPQGEMFTHMGDWLQQARDVGGYAAYKTLGSKAGQAISRIPQVIPKAIGAIPESTSQIAPVINIGTSPAVRSLPSVMPAAASQPQPQPQPQPAPKGVMPMGVPQAPAPQQIAPADSKGPDKWANDGFHNMKGHVNDQDRQFLEKYKGAMLVDPKAKELLVTASNYAPGSKPLDDVLKHLKKQFGEK